MQWILKWISSIFLLQHDWEFQMQVSIGISSTSSARSRCLDDNLKLAKKL